MCVLVTKLDVCKNRDSAHVSISCEGRLACIEHDGACKNVFNEPACDNYYFGIDKIGDWSIICEKQYIEFTEKMNLFAEKSFAMFAAEFS